MQATSPLYVFGFDLGISSVGWSVVEYIVKDSPNGGSNLFPYRLIDCGVRQFSPAKVGQAGESPNVLWRQKRSSRRSRRRKQFRLYRIRKVLEELGWISSPSDLDTYKYNVWESRYRALDSEIDNLALAKVIYQIMKRRGFKSNRKSESTGEEGDYKKAISENLSILKEKGYRTYGEMLFKDIKFKNHKRNRDGDFLVTLSRDELKSELKLILESQKRYKKEITEEVIRRILDIFSSQRPVASGKQVLSLVGNCSLIPGEKRASKFSPTIEYKNFLEKLNNTRIENRKNGFVTRELDSQEKDLVIKKALSLKTMDLKYQHVRKVIGLTDDEFFVGLRYSDGKNPETQRFASLPGTALINNALVKSQYDYNLDRDQQDLVATVLTFYATDEDIKSEINNLFPDMPDSLMGELLKITNFKGTSNISLKAAKMLIPYLEEGRNYYDSVKLSGLEINHVMSGDKIKLPAIDVNEIKNPVVLRTLSQARKVLNALIDKYGSPIRVNVELARSLALNDKIQGQIQRKQNEQRLINEKIIKILKDEFGISNPSGTDLLKYKLWEEQLERCVYSGVRIAPERLFKDPNYTHIDHVIPFSRSLDDRYFNKVLCLSSENSNKKNQTPFEYFGGTEKSSAWGNFVSLVNSLRLHSNKRRLLLQTALPSSDEALKKFINRNLTDTQYISTYFANFIRENLKFNDHHLAKRKVYTVNGRATAVLRTRWGLSKQRDESLRHHAQDAIITGVVSPSLLLQIQSWSKSKETFDDLWQEDDTPLFPQPWQSFRDDVFIRVFKDDFTELMNNSELKSLYGDLISDFKPLFVSRMPERKLSGALHEETIISPNEVEPGFYRKRISISQLNKKNFDKIVGNDEVVKRVLREKLEASKWDAKKAFLEPVYKPSKNGKGNRIQKITIADSNNSVIPARTDGSGRIIGLASNAKIVRVDVFRSKSNGDYYVVPVYAHHVAKKELPNKAIRAEHSESDWTNMTPEEYEFQFSLYTNDLVQIEKKGEVLQFYFSSVNRWSGVMTGYSHDGAGNKVEKSYKKLDSMHKLQVDILGNRHFVKEKIRYGF